jgi:hypothetical protein
MRTFGQLSRDEKKKAIEKALTELVDCAANGLITFGQNLQSKINFAIEKALKENMQWSTQEYILESAKPELFLLAKGIAEDAKYKDDGELIRDEEL